MNSTRTAFLVLGLLVSLVLALVSLSTRSGYVVFLERPVPVRIALSTTPVGFVWGRLGEAKASALQARIEAWPANRRGLDDAPDLLMSYAVLAASALGLLFLQHRHFHRPSTSGDA